MPATGSRSGRRLRGADLALLIGSYAAVIVSLLVATGPVTPGLFTPNPTQWSIRVPTCPFPESVPIVQHTFPLWATVHVHWSATAGYVTLYSVHNSGPGPSYPIYQGGTSGNGSFISDAYLYTFHVGPFVPVNASRCTPIVVTTIVTYSI